jgi:PAS domain S-box-containing protein
LEPHSPRPNALRREVPDVGDAAKLNSQKSKPVSAWRNLGEITAVALIYAVTGWIGRAAAPPPGIATVVWPPSGVALAALLIFGTRIWPGIWLGAFLENNWAALPHSNARAIFSFLAAGAAIDTGALLQALLGASLFRRFIGDRNPFDRFKYSVIFIAIALSMCLAGCTVGVASLYLGGMLPWDSIFGRWWTWWIGGAGGVLVVMPLILTAWRLPRPDWSRSRWVEAVLVFAACIFFAMVIFVWWRPPAELRYPADLLLLPLLALVAYRYTQREVALLVVLFLAIAVGGTLHDRGPYRGSPAGNSLPVLQAFMGILSILSITVGAIITERRIAGDALKASERWLRETQRISQIGSYVLDVQTGEWTSSEILDEILGIGPEYPHTREGWHALLHPEDLQDLRAFVTDEVIAKGREFQRECRIVRPRDGKIRWVLCGGELSRDSRKLPSKLAGTILDITERKAMEAQLLQAQKMESIGRLAGGVAHDFNNLLTVINGYADLALRQVPANNPVHSQIQAIRGAGDRAAELTMQLLAFSRKQVLQPKALSLNDMLRDSDGMLRSLIGEEIELVCICDPLLRRVEADPGQMQQVILNLAVNARDAMPEGGKLTIETANAGSEVILSVRDTGHGMDAETMEHVFEPFFTTKGIGKGTGLGLATVYGIVRQSAGHIAVHSEVGRGATFTVFLPAVEGEPALPGAAKPMPTGSGSVLLVEDERDVRRLAATILENHGYRVLAAADGEEALLIYERYGHPIDLLISDVIMPRMRGPELAAHLRTRQPEMRVLYISGYSDPSIANQMVSAASHFLQKPFAAEALVRAVNDALG